jgi:glycosyltransferase involved in cell wall biosynthesis
MLDAARLPEVLRRADVGVVPHRSDLFTDGLLPTKLLEYVAVGTPVLASRTPGVAAYFNSSMVSFFEPGSDDSLADCLRGLDRDRGHLNEYPAAAAEFNDRHNWESDSREYVDLVRAVHRHG